MSDDDAEHAYLLTLHIALLHLELREAFDNFCRFVDDNTAAFNWLARAGMHEASYFLSLTQRSEHEPSQPR